MPGTYRLIALIIAILAIASGPARAVDLRITLTVAPPVVGVGDTITAVMQVTNHGPGDSTTGVADLEVPFGLSYVGNSCGATKFFTSVNWEVGTLVNGTSASCTVTFTLASGAAARVLLPADLRVTFPESDPNNVNNLAFAETRMNVPTDGYRLERVVPTLEQPWYAITAVYSELTNAEYEGSMNSDPAGNLVLCGRHVQTLTPSGAVIRQSSFPAGTRETCLAVRDNREQFRVIDGPMRIARYTTAGERIATFGPSGSGAGQLASPVAAAFAADGLLHVVDDSRDLVVTFDPATGAFVREFGAGSFQAPQGIVALDDGRIVVAESDLFLYSSQGQFLGSIDIVSGLPGIGFVRGADGQLYYSHSSFMDEFMVRVYDAKLALLRTVNLPIPRFQDDASVDAVDRDGAMYVVLEEERGVRKFSPSGAIERVWSAGGREDSDLRPYRATTIGAADTLIAGFGNLGFSWRLVRYSADGALVREYSFAPAFSETPRIAAIAGAADGSLVAVTGTTATSPPCEEDDLQTPGCFVFFDAAGNMTGRFRLEYPDGWSRSVLVDIDADIVPLPDATSTRFSVVARDYMRTYGNLVVDGALTARWPAGRDLYAALAPDGDLRLARIDFQDNGKLVVRRYTPTGTLVATQFVGFGELGAELDGFAIAPDGRVVTVHSCFQQFYCRFEETPQIRVLSPAMDAVQHVPTVGALPGMSLGTVDPSFAPNCDLLLTERETLRVSRFRASAAPPAARAIVVSGGGPYAANALWDATEASAGLAFRALAYQGFTKSTVQLLSPSIANDIDANGFFDDVDALATNANLEAAITGSFAADAALLVVYLVDHGGVERFRLSETEMLEAQSLDTWLDQWQSTHPTGQVVVIVDACESGTFIAPLAGPNRVIVTSTSPGENAYFLYRGSVSFSAGLFSQVIAGTDVGTAFERANELLQSAFAGIPSVRQNPQLAADGDTEPNEPSDLVAAQAVVVGNGVDLGDELPQVMSTSGPAAISGTTTATLGATLAPHPRAIGRVWAVLQPPGLDLPRSATPIADLPTVDYIATGPTAYGVTFDGFTEEGTYVLSVFAQNVDGRVSRPLQRTLTVQSPRTRKAVVAVLGDPTDQRYGARTASGAFVLSALVQQGYGPDGTMCQVPACDATFHLQAGGGADATPTLANLDAAITGFAADNADDVIVYLVGARSGAGLRVNATETLSATLLDQWLDELQGDIAGALTVVLETDDAGALIPTLAPPANGQRVVLASSAAGQTALLSANGAQSYTRVLFADIGSGATYGDAHARAALVMRFGDGIPTPQLDDNGNAIANETSDGRLARRLRAGTGLLLAGDPPLAGQIAAPAMLNGADVATVTVSGVRGTAAIASVAVTVRSPSGALRDYTLAAQDETTWSGTLDCFAGETGSYKLLAHAVDENGAVSAGVETSLEQGATGPGPCSSVEVNRLFLDGFE